jgi:clan AA aspartic protease
VGTFSVAIELGDPRGEHWEWVDAVVDTGSTYTWVPASLLQELGVSSDQKFPFELADGRDIEHDIAETRIRYASVERTTVVVFGNEGTQVLLGAYALEGLGLAVDPYNQRLISMRGLLM